VNAPMAPSPAVMTALSMAGRAYDGGPAGTRPGRHD